MNEVIKELGMPGNVLVSDVREFLIGKLEEEKFVFTRKYVDYLNKIIPSNVRDLDTGRIIPHFRTRYSGKEVFSNIHLSVKFESCSWGNITPTDANKYIREYIIALLFYFDFDLDIPLTDDRDVLDSYVLKCYRGRKIELNAKNSRKLLNRFKLAYSIQRIIRTYNMIFETDIRYFEISKPVRVIVIKE